MHTLSDDVGTTPVFQLVPTVHCPATGDFQLSVQVRGLTLLFGLAAPAGAANIPSTRTIPANAVPDIIIKALEADVSFISEPVEEGTTPPAIAAPLFFRQRTVK